MKKRGIPFCSFTLLLAACSSKPLALYACRGGWDAAHKCIGAQLLVDTVTPMVNSRTSVVVLKRHGTLLGDGTEYLSNCKVIDEQDWQCSKVFIGAQDGISEVVQTDGMDSGTYYHSLAGGVGEDSYISSGAE